MTEEFLVILIDDDYGPMDYFKEAMVLNGLRVKHIDSTDSAFDFIRGEESDPPDIFVIDVMMPHGKYLTAKETDDGLETGFYLIEEARLRWPGVPILCLSNVNGSEEIRKRLGSIPFVAKYDVSPFEFASTVSASIGGKP